MQGSLNISKGSNISISAHVACKYRRFLLLTLVFYESKINVSAICEMVLKSLTFFYYSLGKYIPEVVTKITKYQMVGKKLAVQLVLYIVQAN